MGVLKNDADAYINDNAVVDAAGTLTVQAQALSDVGWSWGRNLYDALHEQATYTTEYPRNTEAPLSTSAAGTQSNSGRTERPAGTSGPGMSTPDQWLFLQSI